MKRVVIASVLIAFSSYLYAATTWQEKLAAWRASTATWFAKKEQVAPVPETKEFRYGWFANKQSITTSSSQAEIDKAFEFIINSQNAQELDKLLTFAEKTNLDEEANIDYETRIAPYTYLILKAFEKANELCLQNYYYERYVNNPYQSILKFFNKEVHENGYIPLIRIFTSHKFNFKELSLANKNYLAKTIYDVIDNPKQKIAIHVGESIKPSVVVDIELFSSFTICVKYLDVIERDTSLCHYMKNLGQLAELIKKMQFVVGEPFAVNTNIQDFFIETVLRFPQNKPNVPGYKNYKDSLSYIIDDMKSFYKDDVQKQSLLEQIRKDKGLV